MTDPYVRPEEFEHTKTKLVEPDEDAETSVPVSADQTSGSIPVPPSVAFPTSSGQHYGGDLFAEVQRYAALATEIARGENL